MGNVPTRLVSLPGLTLYFLCTNVSVKVSDENRKEDMPDMQGAKSFAGKHRVAIG